MLLGKEFHNADVAVKQQETTVNELSRMKAETKSATIEAKAGLKQAGKSFLLALSRMKTFWSSNV
jgi:hypothetical protein